MSNTFKLVIIIFLGITIFSGNSVFADARPLFENREVDVLEDGIVRFRAEYDSNNNNYFPTNQPITWFAFGDDRNDLRFRTPRQVRLKGNYIVSQGATLFQRDTIYYVQPFMLFDGEISEGEIRSFNPYIPTPISLTDQQITNTLGQNATLPIVSNTTINQTGNVNTSSSSTPSQLQPPLNNTFNFLDFSQFRNRDNNDDSSGQEIDEEQVDEKISENAISEQEVDIESVSLFQNSATNSDNNINIIREKGDKEIVKVKSPQGNQFSASAANSGVSIASSTYITFIVLIGMIAAAVFLFKLINRKKRNMYRPQLARTKFNQNSNFNYNENQYPYSGTAIDYNTKQKQ